MGGPEGGHSGVFQSECRAWKGEKRNAQVWERGTGQKRRDARAQERGDACERMDMRVREGGKGDMRDTQMREGGRAGKEQGCLPAREGQVKGLGTPGKMRVSTGTPGKGSTSA
jgi:hypothetical protein